MPFGLRIWDGPGNHVQMGIQLLAARSPMGNGNFWGEKGRPIVKYRDTQRLSVQKRPNRSRCHFGFGFGWAKEVID